MKEVPEDFKTYHSNRSGLQELAPRCEIAFLVKLVANISVSI